MPGLWKFDACGHSVLTTSLTDYSQFFYLVPALRFKFMIRLVS